jgi:hypothetical protein
MADGWVFVGDRYRPYNEAQGSLKRPPAALGYRDQGKPQPTMPFVPLPPYPHMDFPAQRARGARFDELRTGSHHVYRTLVEGRIPNMPEDHGEMTVRRVPVAESYRMSTRNFFTHIIGPI